MKKSILLFSAFALLSFINCKKKETTENLAIKPENVTVPVTQDTLIKEAQANPITTLALSEADFDFGVIKKGKKVEHVYEVTNTGKNPLIIARVQPGCGCTVSEFTKEPIMTGQKGQITLKFDSSNFDGFVNKHAEIYANVEKTPITINFRANIK